MKQKYYIGKLEFKTKKECEDYTRNIINTLGCCKINKDHKNFSFFNDLLKNHSEYNDKKGVGIKYFYIQPNALNKKCYATLIKRLDGSKIDFSWLYCCKFKTYTNNHDLIQAMRQAIRHDIIKYKKQSKLICNFCSVDDKPYSNYHVDHDEPSFKTLTDNFLQSTKKQIPSSFGGCETTHVTIFNDEDEDFENEWNTYHNKHCNLQILCKDCNLKKKKI